MSTRTTGQPFGRWERGLAIALLLLGMLHATSAAAANRSTRDSRRVELDHVHRVAGSRPLVDVESTPAIPRPPADVSEAAGKETRSNPMRSAAPSTGSHKKPKTLIAQAAYGEVLSEPVPPGLQPMAPHGHSVACDGCGDCASCDACPTCGIEAVCGVEASCGVEGFACGTPGCDSCGGYVEPGCGVGGPYGGGYAAPGVECVPFFLPILPIDWCRFEFFAGVQGFTGPSNFPTGLGATDRVGTGSFGFHQGLNEGRSLMPWLGIDWGAQLGLRATQNNLSGAGFTADDRHQMFLTGGFYRRVDYGLQMGIVVDYLNDDWYYHSDLTQLRGELSWKFAGCHEVGYRVMGGSGDSSSQTVLIDDAGGQVNGTILLEATDQHRFFYRRQLGGEGLIDAFVGTTDQEDTLLGLSVDTPLRGRLGLKTGVAYLNPSEADGLVGNRNESWNVSLSIVWRPCGRTGKCDGYYKPLFDVADNGTMMVDRR